MHIVVTFDLCPSPVSPKTYCLWQGSSNRGGEQLYSRVFFFWGGGGGCLSGGGRGEGGPGGSPPPPKYMNHIHQELQKCTTLTHSFSIYICHNV